MAEQLSSLDLIGMLRRSLGNPATGDVDNQALSQYIWLAECDLAEMYEFAELRDEEAIKTWAGTHEYEMENEDILRFLDPANNVDSSIPMKRMDADWDRRVGSLITGQGTPFYFFEHGIGDNGRKRILIRPIPDARYNLIFPFIKIPTMLSTETAQVSDLPQSHMLQVLSRATEIGLQMEGERGEADAQNKLSAKQSYAARHALPGGAFYTNRLMTFQQRMNLNRRGRRG